MKKFEGKRFGYYMKSDGKDQEDSFDDSMYKGLTNENCFDDSI